ncbi:unnamed protein product, partial [Lymnaea stagnalis]
SYVPWNLHEPAPGLFRNEGILDLRRFIKTAADLDLFVIFRPGPYICSEWDFGGLPSWLLADPEMKVRSNYLGYQEAVKRYFDWLIPQVADLQYTHGGPVVAVQVENEFGSFSDDPGHLEFLRELLLNKGIKELLVTSDNESAIRTAPVLDGVLPTANGQTVEEIKAGFQIIRSINDQYPLMVMEFWTGWFDHWGYPHETRSVDILEKTLNYALEESSNVNFYMFHGGTNFGFMAGALNLSSFKADVTSYDYDAPLAEDGGVTEKFLKIQKMIGEVTKTKNSGTLEVPTVMADTNRAAVPLKVPLDKVLPWSEIIKTIRKKSKSKDPQFMESYAFENGWVQSFGYIVYRKEIEQLGKGRLDVTGRIKDRASILMNGKTRGVLTWESESAVLDLLQDEGGILDIVVENLGRVNYTTKDKQDVLNTQRKGFDGEVRLDDGVLQDWEIFALDFPEGFVDDALQSPGWQDATGSERPAGPALFRGSVQLSGKPGDYFVRLDRWFKGVVIVNGFNLGRYWDQGPQRTLYLPGPLLREGANSILVFEENTSSGEITLDIKPCLG